MASPDDKANRTEQPTDTQQPRRRGTTSIRLRPPGVVPMSADDQQKAVTALSTMIAAWWQETHGTQTKQVRPE